MLRSVRNLLDAHGFEVRVFSSAEDFLARADISDAAALSSTFIFQGCPGLSYINSCPDPGHPVPAIFITGKDTEITRLAAMGTGRVAYLTKPFLAEALVNALKKVFGSDAA
jgi:FixJ family two-component response regulator